MHHLLGKMLKFSAVNDLIASTLYSRSFIINTAPVSSKPSVVQSRTFPMLSGMFALHAVTNFDMSKLITHRGVPIDIYCQMQNAKDLPKTHQSISTIWPPNCFVNRFFCVMLFFRAMSNRVHPQPLGVLDGLNSFEGHLRLLGGVDCWGKHIVNNSPISECSTKTQSTKGTGANGKIVYRQCQNAFLQKSSLSISVQTNFIVMAIAIHSSLFCVTSIPLKLLQRNIEDHQQTQG